ncbi:MAG: efflux RND transporter periplasmic adaptor subunit, partial [Candidatus Nanoarchaeia archaeon]
IAPRNLVDYLTLPGIVESWATIKISAEIIGSIVSIEAEKGQKLSAGQILMKIDDRTYRAEKNKALANLDFARRAYERQTKLFSVKTSSEKELEDAKNTLSEKEAELEIATANLEKCEIRSPIQGYLDDRPVELGEYVQPGTHVATIVMVDKVKLTFAVPEKDIAFVRTDIPIAFTLDAIPEREFHGKTIFVSKSANMESLSYRVELEVENTDGVLRPGMIARVRLQKPEVKNAILVPINAVIPKYEGHYVFVANKDGRASLREVRIALISGQEAMIANGLVPGEFVVIEGHRLLNENDDLLILK